MTTKLTTSFGARVTALLVALAVAGVLALGFGAPPAHAAPYNNKPTLSLSTSSAEVGQTITVTGRGYVPGETVRIEYNGNKYFFKTVVADSSGSFVTTITLPRLSGNFQVVGTGSTGDKANAKLRVVGLGFDDASASRGNGSGSGTSSSAAAGLGVDAASASRGGLSSTGVAVFSIVGLGVVLLLAGGLLVLGGRRARHAS